MARRGRKPTGLQQKMIKTDSLLAKLLGVQEGTLVSPLDVSRGLSRYTREHNLSHGMEVEVDGLLSQLTGFRAGERKPRTQLIQELWRHIDRHGLKVEANPKEQLRKVVKAAEEQVDKGVPWVDALLWALVVVGGAFVLSKLLQGGQGGQGGGGGGGGQPPQPPPPSTGEGGGLPEVVEPVNGVCPDAYYMGSDGLCHRLW